MKKAFTIVELLVVVAIIGILLGLVTMAANGALKNARAKRATAMCAILQQGVNAYYAKKGEWPTTIENKSKNMNGKDVYVFEGGEADAVFQEIVKLSVGANASMRLLDPMGLFVAESGRLKNGGNGCFDNHGAKNDDNYCGNKGCINGRDFSAAVKKGDQHLSISKMAFGYPGKEHGKFCRYWISYNGRTDSVTVSETKPSTK